MDLNKLKRVEIIQCVFSDHRGIKLEFSKRIPGKSPNKLAAKRHSSKHMGQRRNLQRNQKYFELKKMKHNLSNAVGYSDSSAQREIYSIECIFSKDLKLIIEVSTLIVQTTTQLHSPHTLAK